MRLVSLAVLASASAFVVGPALAQSPLVEKNVSMGMALAIIQGTLEQCTKDGYKVSVTIVDKAGNVAASIRGDGTNPHTMEFSRLKAYPWPDLA
jgi:Haem-degrading